VPHRPYLGENIASIGEKDIEIDNSEYTIIHSIYLYIRSMNHFNRAAVTKGIYLMGVKDNS
jgi:hypothetical protein